jgi:apolipoprotein N-acyltransferase
LNRATAPRARGARFVWLIAGGLCITAAFLMPNVGVLAWLGLIPLFRFAPRARSVREGALDGLVTGLAVVVPAFFWLVGTIHRFGGIPLPLALVVYTLFALFAASQVALVGAWLRFAGPSASLLLAPAVWTGVELLFPNLFPWRPGLPRRRHGFLVIRGRWSALLWRRLRFSPTAAGVPPRSVKQFRRRRWRRSASCRGT